MYHYQAKIAEIEATTGLADHAGRISRKKAQEELEELMEERDYLKQVLQYYEEMEFSAKDAYEAQVQIANSSMESIENEVKNTKEKSEILVAYMGVMRTDEFVINRLKTEMDQYREDFWNKLQPIYRKRRQISEQLELLKMKHDEWSDLQKKTNVSMASDPA